MLLDAEGVCRSTCGRMNANCRTSKGSGTRSDISAGFRIDKLSAILNVCSTALGLQYGALIGYNVSICSDVT